MSFSPRFLRHLAAFGFVGVALCAGAVACSPAASRLAAGSSAGAVAAGSGALVAAPGVVQPRWLLSGELKAARAEVLVVPQTPSWQVEVRWLAADGVEVAAGDKLVELDSSSFSSQLEDKKIELEKKRNALAGSRANAAVQEAEKVYQVAEKKAGVAKAELLAQVPAGLMARREVEELELSLTKARIALTQAEEDLASFRSSTEDDRRVELLEIEKLQREIDSAENAIQSLTLTAPRAGVFLVGEHPWEGRKVQLGDSVHVGFTLGTLPDLTSLIVEAGLPDVDDGAVRPGLPAQVVLDAYPERVFQATVTEVTPVAQERSAESPRRFFRVVLNLAAVDVNLMIPGMSARVEVLGPAEQAAVVAPRPALESTREGTFAWLASGERAVVALGACDEWSCVITAGLPAGTALALAGRGQGGEGGAGGAEGVR